MKSIRDILRKNATTGVAPAQNAPAPGATAQASSLLRTRSGKAGADSGPARSALAETAQIDAAGTQLQDIADAANQAGQQLAQQSDATVQGYQQERTIINTQDDAQRTQFQSRVDQILGDLERQGDNLDVAKEGAALEQLSFYHSLGDEKYIHALDMEAARENLQDEIQFREALQKSIFGELDVLFRKDLSLKSLLDANDRTQAEKLSAISIDQAIAIATAAAEQANSQAIYSGAGQMITGGIQAYGAMDPEPAAGTSPEVPAGPTVGPSRIPGEK